MILMCAQPDEEYFVWQLNVMIANFVKFGISKEEIHILISYDPTRGVRNNMKKFAEISKNNANFYFYPDTRLNKRYLSTIRPHIIKKHYRAFPMLEKKAIFYHDSDIIFTTGIPPKLNEMGEDGIIYVSDASSYLNVNYILSKGNNLLSEMCTVLNIHEDLVRENDNSAGGAQYVLKNLNYEFWNIVEEDSLKLFNYFKANEKKQFNRQKLLENKEKPSLITSWCADMWAILWNLYKSHEVKISKDLDFCWPHDSMENWFQKYIFHNAGITEDIKTKYFYKAKHYLYSPYDVDFSYVPKTVCDFNYIEAVQKCSVNLDKYLDDTSIILFGTDRYRTLIESFFAFVGIHEFRWVKLGERISSDLIDQFGSKNRVLFYNAEYLIDKSRLMAMQNANGDQCITSIGYNLNTLSPTMKKMFMDDFDFSKLDLYAGEKSISFFHKFSALTIEKSFLYQLLAKKKIIFNESLIKNLSYLVLTYGELINIDNDVKVEYRIN